MKRSPIEMLDLGSWLGEPGSGAILSRESQDLDLNLVQFANGDGVAPHVNSEVDVLVLALAGEGVVTVDGTARQLSPLQAIIIPRGVERAIASLNDGVFVYLTVHRRRAGLWPSPVAR